MIWLVNIEANCRTISYIEESQLREVADGYLTNCAD
jgi:hypothetical protein